MYYQVVVETSEKIAAGKNRKHTEYDNENLEDIKDRIIKPYFGGLEIHFDGYFIEAKSINRLSIKETEKPIKKLRDEEIDRHARNGVIAVVTIEGVLSNATLCKDITNDLCGAYMAGRAQPSTALAGPVDRSKVFIVHGRDAHPIAEVARFVESLGLTAIILHEQASAGKTIIEKIEEYSDVTYAVVLYTPCDIGGINGGSQQKARARQNVVFEHGYLMGKLGRQSVCALVKGDVEIPNDISGVVYIEFGSNDAWRLSIAKELRRSGFTIDANKMIN